MNKNQAPNIIRYILLLLCISLGLRLIFFIIYKPWDPEIEKQQVIYSDAKGYHKIALNLIEHQNFMDNKMSELSAVQTPLYPIFIATIYKLAGERPWIVLVVQILLDTVSCIILYFMLYPFFGYSTSFIGSFFFAVNPFQIIQCNILGNEVLFVFFLILMVFFFTKAITANNNKRRIQYYGLSGLLMGLATLVKPISLYLPFFLVLYLVYIYRHKIKFAVIYSLLIILIFTATVLPWFVRNYKEYGHFSFSVSASLNLLILNVASMGNVSQKERKIELKNEVNQIIFSQNKDPNTLNPFEKAVYWKETALKYIKKNPFHFIQAYVKGICGIFVTLNSSGFRNMLHLKTAEVNSSNKDHISRFQKLKSLSLKENISTYIIILILGLYLTLLYINVIIGWITYSKIQKKYQKEVLLFFTFIALYFILITGVAGMMAARFKVPVLPFLFPMAALGIERFKEKYSWR